jgi:cytochrome b involved in lipid metabolism
MWSTVPSHAIQHFQVYDVTPFMDEHPGGDEVLLAVTGKSFSFHFIMVAETMCKVSNPAKSF